MSSIDVSVRNSLRIRLDDLTEEQRTEIRDSLSFTNPAYTMAIKEMMDTRTIPKRIHTVREEDGYLLVPRGATDTLRTIMEGIRWWDRRRDVPCSIDADPVLLRPHQEEPIEALLEREQGVYEAPPGSGKTVVCLELWRRAARRCVVLVDRKNIAEQWRDRARTHLGVEAGFVGDDRWEEQDITIALVQTLRSRMDELKAKRWFDDWGMVLVDECHHVQASGWASVVESFPARYRFGVSATPDRENDMYAMTKAVLGPTVHTTEKDELVETGTLMKPEIRMVRTDFSARYIGTHEARHCQHDDCHGKGRVHRNNFTAMMGVLAVDEDRASIVVDTVLREKGRTQMVISKRLKHLALIASPLEAMVHDGDFSDDILWLTGKQDTKERMDVIRRAAQGSCVIMSTLADEALDIPQLDVIHLAWPSKSAPLVQQQIGRVERTCPGKDRPIVYDYVDSSVGVRDNQWRNRRDRVYGAGGYEVTDMSSVR